MRLIVDSSSDLPKEIRHKYNNIDIVPLTIRFGDKEYRDGIDLESEEFYQLLKTESESPKTSQVVPEQFKEVFQKYIEEDQEILCITIGSEASGTCQSAFLAKQDLASDKIQVLDSNGLCMGTGYLAVMALQMMEMGKSMNEILDELRPLTRNKIEHLFCVDTLTYLKRGGRIKASKALVAEVLNIKPILHVEDALTQTIGKVRGRKKVIPYYLKHIEKTMDFEKSPFLSVAHSADPKFADLFIEAFLERYHWEKPIYISELGATIGAHAGPGVLALFYLKK